MNFEVLWLGISFLPQHIPARRLAASQHGADEVLSDPETPEEEIIINRNFEVLWLTVKVFSEKGVWCPFLAQASNPRNFFPQKSQFAKVFSLEVFRYTETYKIRRIDIHI